MHDVEKGFGTGLRATLERKLNPDEPAVEAGFELELVQPLPDELAPPPLVLPDDAPSDFAELTALRAELEDALEREQQLRESLQHHVEAYERELDAGRDVALREAEADQRALRLDELEASLKDERDRHERERAELSSQREGLVAEQARLETLAAHMDERVAALESADAERARAAANIAQQLAAIEERERELKRARSAMDQQLHDAETRIKAREEALRTLDAGLAARERALAEREAAAKAAAAAASEERRRLEGLGDAVSQREANAEKRTAAREQMLANGEAALAAWEKRLREQSERLERERAGHGQASQEAFALLAELEQREQVVGERETKLLLGEESLTQRRAELDRAVEELRVRDARRSAELDLREDRLEERETTVAERERRIEERERDVTAYVSQLQGSLNDRSVA